MFEKIILGLCSRFSLCPQFLNTISKPSVLHKGFTSLCQAMQRRAPMWHRQKAQICGTWLPCATLQEMLFLAAFVQTNTAQLALQQRNVLKHKSIKSPAGLPNLQAAFEKSLPAYVREQKQQNQIWQRNVVGRPVGTASKKQLPLVTF